MQWDFLDPVAESARTGNLADGDRGIPRNWRHMNGYSSHTYMCQRRGERFGSSPLIGPGIECLTQEEADVLAAADRRLPTRDLFEAIGRGE